MPKKAYKIGFMGTAGRGQELPEGFLQLARQTGREVAKQGCTLVTGACMGTPHEAALGAVEEGGKVIGFSPAKDLNEHISPPISYPKPPVGMELVFTGLGKARRNFESIDLCDAVIFCAGRAGTLMEFAIAFHEGKAIGFLQDVGGISDRIPELVEMINKDTGAVVFGDADPKDLVSQLINELEKRN